MQNKWSKWVVGLSLAAALVLGLTPLATTAQTWTPAQLKPTHPHVTASVAATSGKRAQGQAPAFQVKLSPAMVQLKAEMKAAGVKPWQLPKQRFQYPVYRMLVNAALKAGVPVSQAIQKNPESLCETQAGWFNGPAMASNTNGTAIIYGGGMNFYFASASDPTHPFVMPAGDVMMRVYFQGNTAIVMGLFGAYAFDVSNPTQPALLGYDYAGYAYGFTGFGMTSDGQWIVGTYYYDDLVVWDNTFTYVTDTDLESIATPAGFTISYSPDLTDMTVVGSTVLITDWDNYYIHFVDLSDVACSGPMYLGYIDDSAYGVYDCGQIMYQAPYLYTVDEPWYNYNPLGGYNICPDNSYSVDIFSVPDVTKPANFISVKLVYVNNYGNDIVAIRPAGNGDVALGLYDGQVAIWDAQFNTLLSFGTFGKFGPATQGYGWCGSEPNWDYFTLDMGYDPTAGGVTANWGGGAYFFNGSLAAAGSYTTGDWTYNPIAVGNTIYTPEYVAGLAIVDGTNPTDPATLGWLPTTAGLPFIGKVAVDGTTAYVAADYNTSYTKVFAADVTNPAAPGYLSTASTAFDITSGGYGTEIESLTANGGICWIGTNTSLVGVDFLTNPSAPTVVASFTIAGSGAYGMTTFTLPAFPVSHFLAIAEGGYIEVYDITSPTQYAGCPTPYFFVNRLAPTGWATDLFAYNSYLIYNDITNNAVSSMSLTANVGSACNAGEVVLASSSTLTLGVIGGPYLVAYAGTVGGHVVMAAADQWSMTTIDITDPTHLAFLNSTPQVVGNLTWSGNTGLFFSNGALYNAGGYVGLANFLLEPGFKPPVVNSVTVTPAISGYLTGSVTLDANVTAADSAVTSVVFTFDGGTVATVPTNIAPGAKQDVTYTWNTSTWRHACGAYNVVATAYDSGCNESVAVNSSSTYNINLAPSVVLGKFDPAPPSGSTCVAPGSWVVCGTMTFIATATDGTCNQVTGISQMSLYVDGVFVTYINNPAGDTWAITLDTTTLTDGPHTVTVTATDAMGLTGSVSSATFLVHNVGPTVVVTAPVSGNVVSGHAIRVAATAVPSTSDFSVVKVVFYLDQNSTNPVVLGTATTPDANGEYSITWDSTANGTNTGYGNHDITAMALDNSGSCASWGKSDLVSFNLIQYTAPKITATATPTTGNIPLAVAFAANVTDGQAPFTYAWTFGDGSTGSGQATTHTYTTAGTFNWSVTVTDAQNNTATASDSITAINPVVPPTISSIKKALNPFRLVVLGGNFHSAVTASIGGASWSNVVVKNGSKVVIKGGKSLKALLPKGTPVAITITNTDDGGTSAVYTFTR